MDVKCLGHVAEGAVVKIVDPDSGNICGPNEVHICMHFSDNLKAFFNHNKLQKSQNAKDFREIMYLDCLGIRRCLS